MLFMTENNLLEIAELQRRLFTMIQIGKVTAVNHADATVRVNIDGVLTTDLPWLSQKAGNNFTWWSPEENEQVLVLSIGGELTNGVVLPAIYQSGQLTADNTETKHHTTYSDGTSISYDTATHELLVNINGGNVTINTTGNIQATAEGDAVVNASGDVRVDGENIILNGGLAGGVVCEQHTCSFTGSPHPHGSSKIKGAV